MGELTSPAFWDAHYEGRLPQPFDPTDWRDYVTIQLARLLASLGLADKRVLEIGGGDARLLAWLAKTHPSGRFAVLDRSSKGCSLARSRARNEKVPLDVYEGDMFAPPAELVGAFDVVISLGLIEHFQDTSEAIAAKRVFLKPGRVMFSLIPNLASPIYRYLTRRWSVRVLNMHVVLSLAKLVQAHMKAGLEVIDYGYLGSVEFGMLSMAARDLPREARLDRALYLWLTRLSKAVHWFEYHVRDLPTTRTLSPFLWVVAKRCD